jgi:hypothetical protein
LKKMLEKRQRREELILWMADDSLLIFGWSHSSHKCHVIGR